MIIDFHTHAFPDRLAAGALAHLVDNARAYARIYGPACPHTDATLDGLAASSRRSGMDLSLVLPIATSPKPSQTINNFAAQADQYPGLRSFGTVHPENPDWEAELERVAALGLRGIKLHPEYQGFFVDDPACRAVVKRAASLGLWVIFHAGADIGMPPPIHCTPERVVRLRQDVPDAKIVLAHMGGFCLWEEVLRALPAMGTAIDTSYCIAAHPDRWPLFAAIIRAAGTANVFFGTDSPWEDQKESLVATRRFLEQSGFEPAERAAILGGNAARVLGLSEAPDNTVV